MRASQLLGRPAGVERADHVCWAYTDDASFEEAALRFLTEGLAAGDRLLWVGDGAADRLRRSRGPLAADPLHRPDLLRWEHLADDFVASGSGFSALCAYRSDVRLDFIDLAGVRAVARWADELRARPAGLDLVGTSRLFRRMWQVLRPEGAPGVRFRTAAG